MFGRLMNVIRGFFAQFVSGVEKRNPEALLELEQENLRKQIGSYNQSLAVHAGLAERLIGQVRKLETEENELRARTTAHLRAGNKDAAAQHALRLQTVTRELQENRTQMAQAEDTYKNLVKARDVAVNAARAKIQNLKGAINDLRMKTALADQALADFAAAEGISLEGEAAAPAPSRNMGAQEAKPLSEGGQ